MLANIWSGGCNPQLRYALPIMFSWEVFGLALSGLGVYRRAHYATLADESQEHQFRERLNAAVEYNVKRDHEIRGEMMQAESVDRTSVMPAETAGPDDGEKAARRAADEAAAEDAADQDVGVVRAELARVISNVNEQARREQRRNALACGFGPAFPTPFGSDDSDDS